MLFRQKLALFLVGVPVGGATSLVMYVKYRKFIRPTRHQFPEIINAQGALVLGGKTLPRPSAVAVAARSIKLFAIFFPVGILYLLMGWTEVTYKIWVKIMLWAIECGGPVFVKLGQWSCTREDLFTKPFRDECKRLYNDTSRHSFAVTLRVLEQELKEDPYNVFETLDPVPVGSGSIGQVHVGTLKATSSIVSKKKLSGIEKVVVKVMHPNIENVAAKDFLILQHFASFLDRWVPSMARYELPRMALAFSYHLAAQLDFRMEEQNLTRFREHFKGNRGLLLPQPLGSTQRSLIETFCEGKPAHPEYLASLPQASRSSLARTGLNAWCQMLLHDNFIHGDMHPGNILIDCSKVAEPKVYLIDVGLCQQLTAEEALVSHELMESFVQWCPKECSDSIWRMAETQRFGNKKVFEDKIQDLFRRFRPSRNDSQAVTKILESIFHAVRDCNIQMDPPFVSLLFSVLVLESFVTSLDNNFNMVRHSAPWLIAEGSISKGVIKNYIKSNWHALCDSTSLYISGLREVNQVREAEKVQCA